MVLKINDFVEVCTEKYTGFGEVRWMGIIPEKSREDPMVGIVMTSFQAKDSTTSDGMSHGKQYFTSPNGQGIFAYRDQVSKLDKYPIGGLKLLSEIVLPGPLVSMEVCNVLNATNGNAGIVGYKNSSYMDSTLLCLFGFRNEYVHTICKRLSKPDKNCLAAQRHLRTIVKKLRSDLHLSIPWEDIMALRKILDLDEWRTTWSTTEKDPCKLLDKLFTTILKQPRLLEMSISRNGQDQPTGDGHFLVMNSSGAPAWRIPLLQYLLDATVARSDAFLDQIPKHLIVVLPENEYKKHGGAILPSFELDITNILRAHPKQCGLCGALAMYQCKECYLKFGFDLSTTYFCSNCHAQCHEGLEIKHSFRRVMANHGYQGKFSTRVTMELCALLCHREGHYVNYVKCLQPRDGLDWEWFLFDSMNGATGEEEGKPKMEPSNTADMIKHTSEYREEMLKFLDDNIDPRDDHTRDFFQKGYLAFYNNPKLLYF